MLHTVTMLPIIEAAGAQAAEAKGVLNQQEALASAVEGL